MNYFGRRLTPPGQGQLTGEGLLAQAKELLDHLEGVLSSEPVEVVPGNSIVEVKPQGVSKGGAVERILLEAAAGNTAHDVVVCIGDDRSDEDMYTAIEHVAVMPHMPAEVRRSLQPMHLKSKCSANPSEIPTHSEIWFPRISHTRISALRLWLT